MFYVMMMRVLLHRYHPFMLITIAVPFFCSDCPLPLTQQCNRVHAVGLHEPGQIGSSSHQLSFVPLICETSIHPQHFMVSTIVYVWYSVSGCRKDSPQKVSYHNPNCCTSQPAHNALDLNPDTKLEKRKRHRESERGLL